MKPEQQVDRELDKLNFVYQDNETICVDYKNIKLFIHAEIKQAVLDVVEETITMIDKKGDVYSGSDWIISVLRNHYK